MEQNKGWICPRCGKIWAPYIDYCLDCIKVDTATIISKFPKVTITDSNVDTFMNEGYPIKPMDIL